MGVGVFPRRVAAEPESDRGQIFKPHRPDSVLLILVVVGVLALGLVLRFVCQSDLWADEVLSVNIAKLPLNRLGAALRHDGAPPLYYAGLHVWMRVFGAGNTAVRAFSGFAGAITLVPIYFVGRRLDQRRWARGSRDHSLIVAWSAVLLLALSPFAIRYSTEARMYALAMLLVTLGYLAVVRAFERPAPVRLVLVATVTGLLLYTHYWAFPLLGVVGVVVLAVAWRGTSERRRAAWFVLGALAAGGLTFIPWLTSFRFQLAHTGTPWGAPVSPFGSWATAFKSFGGNAHLAGWILVALVLFGLFAAAVDARHVEFDLATRPGVRLEAFVAFATLGVGLVVARLSGTTFEGRYASVAYPLFVVVAAFGVAAFSDARVRVGLLCVALILGAWGGISNAQRNRTQAYQLAPIIRDHAVAGDVVLFCPDAIGTDVVGRLPSEVQSVGFPNLDSPARIDWVDYARKVNDTRPVRFADRVLALAKDHTIWLVFTDNGTPADAQCAKIADVLTVHRPGRIRELEPDPYFFEHQGLYRYPASN